MSKVFVYSFEGKQLSTNTLEEKLDNLRERGIEITGYQITENELRIVVSNLESSETMNNQFALASITTITVGYVIMATITMLGAYFIRLQFVKVVDKIDDTGDDTKKFFLNVTEIVKYGILLSGGWIAYNEYKKLR